MSQNRQNNTQDESQLSLVEILQIVKGYLIEVVKYSWLMLIFAVIFGKYMRDRKLSSPTTYTANFSFTLNEVVTENQQSIASLFGSVGGTGDNGVNFKKLQEIILTRKIISKVLFHKAILTYENPKKEDFLINHYLRLFYYKGGDPKNYYYFETDSIDPYDKKANSLLLYTHAAIARNHLIIEPTSGNIMHLKAISTSEDFSYELVTALYSELNAYYKEEAVEKSRRFYEMAQERTNQLRGKLSAAEEKYIKYVNTHGAEAGGRNNTLIKTQFLATDLKNATESYFLALSSREGAWVAYEGQKQTPSMSIIDAPLYPLTVVRPDPFLHMIAGGIVGAGLIFIIIVGRKFFRDLISKEKDLNNKDQDDASQVQDKEKPKELV